MIWRWWTMMDDGSTDYLMTVSTKQIGHDGEKLQLGAIDKKNNWPTKKRLILAKTTRTADKLPSIAWRILYLPQKPSVVGRFWKCDKGFSRIFFKCRPPDTDWRSEICRWSTGLWGAFNKCADGRPVVLHLIWLCKLMIYFKFKLN